MTLVHRIMMIAVLFIRVSSFCVAQQSRPADSFASIQKLFLNPGKEYGSAPLWVWNTRVTHAIIDSMLAEFKQQGFGGVMVHPRPGLITPYLSAEWFALWKYAMEKAKQLDLDIWIYDENSYPSGFAGGHVPNEMPASFEQGQMMQLQKTDRLPPDSNDYFIALERMPDGRFRRVQAKNKPAGGDYYLFTKSSYHASPWYGGFSYVDLMVPGVTERFLEVTMKRGYERVVGSEFGKTVKGIFSDEPNIEPGSSSGIRWTPLLFPAFSRKWGYRLEDNLPSLFEETGDWKKVRHNYYSVLLDLFIEYWSKPMHNYAAEKKLEWTGHYWEHEWPNLMHGIDNMAMYAWHQRPGIDMLFNRFDEYYHEAQFGNIRSVKELSSVANQLGKKRTLSETYGGAGWELTFKDMKRLGDWEFVLGVNTLNQHLSYMSLEGARKYDYPQSFSYHNPWWPYYRNLNLHFARLSLALSSGKQKNEILVLEPTTTSWMYYRYTDSNRVNYRTGQDFQSFVKRLEKAQVEYDLGCEDIIKRHGLIAGKRFLIGEASYTTVVIPAGTENINKETYLLLDKFRKQGGEILVFDTLCCIDGKKDKRLEELVQPNRRFQGLAGLDDDVVQNYLSNPAIRFGPIDTTRIKLYHQRRQLGDGQLLFLANSSMENAAQGNFFIAGKDALLLNTMTGEITDYPEKESGGGIIVDYDIAGAGSLLLFISDRPVKSKPGIINSQPASTATGVLTTKLQVKRLRPNVLTLDFCDLELKDTTLHNRYFYQAADYLFKRNGFPDGDPWNTSVQFKDHTIRRDTFGSTTGFLASYHFTIDSGIAGMQNLKAVVERAHLWEVSINGQKMKAKGGEWYLDKDFAVFDLGRYIQPGTNTITLEAPRMSIYAEIQPVYILGNFDLAADSVAWKIVPAKEKSLGSWKSQGMPLYGHEMVYRKSFEVRPGNKKYWLQTGDWKGTVAVLKVNNKEVTILLGNEKQYDISGYVTEGNNEVELIITGSLKNTLGPHYNKYAPGMVSPWHWRYVYRQLPGTAYDLYDYGLMEDFTIYQSQ